jgi:hypothetical protein
MYVTYTYGLAEVDNRNRIMILLLFVDKFRRRNEHVTDDVRDIRIFIIFYIIKNTTTSCQEDESVSYQEIPGSTPGQVSLDLLAQW